MDRKINIQKYREFLKESLDPYKLKHSINSFNIDKSELFTIPGDLKDLSFELKKEFSNIKLPYEKILQFGGIDIDLRIIISNEYNSSINWHKFMNDINEITISIPIGYDIDYLISIIIHEIRHMIDFTDENFNSGLSSFDYTVNLNKFYVGNFTIFNHLFYLSLEHELIARNNQIYPYIKFKKLSKEQSLSILKTSFIWKSLDDLENFNVDDFISKFKLEDLIKMTNSFIEEVLLNKDNEVSDYNDIVKFYNTFNNYFLDISKKWRSILLSEHDRVYERYVNLYTENNEYYKNILKKINNIIFK